MTLVRTVRDDWGFLEDSYGLHLGRKGVARIDYLAIWLCMGSNRIMLKGEGYSAHRSNKFLGEAIGIDGQIVRVENWHYTTMVVEVCTSPVYIVLRVDTVCTRYSLSLDLVTNLIR